MRDVEHFIGGAAFVDSADGRTFESITPIDNTPIATVAKGGPDDVDRAVTAAGTAFETWSTAGPTERERS